ncbi:MAG: hypothetical protein HGA19_02700 [Oscillochloris sp.]|nr:hypothetical protein [Oscillochloris sp.]
MNFNITINSRMLLPSGLATITVHQPDTGLSEVLDLSFDDLYGAFDNASVLSLDLVLIAGIVYVLDKSVPRRRSYDFWTRTFEVEFPVSNPSLWEVVREPLQTCLRFLTGDEWVVGFKLRAERLFTPRRARRRGEQIPSVGAVSLFSGGLDSLAGVIHRLDQNEGRLLLVGHHDATGPAGDQARLHHDLSTIHRYTDRTNLMTVRMRPLPPGLARDEQIVTPIGREHTLRSRSFVFLALGLYAAHSIGPETPLLVPENGLIAINIPLTPSRVGTCSTRTTHPFFLKVFGEVIGSLGYSNPIINPFELKTKGEILAEISGRDALLQLALNSVSCAHPSRRAIWVRRNSRNCGYCVPCLVRRASFHAIAQDDGKWYGIDIQHGEMDLQSQVASDVRAMLDCLNQVRTQQDIEERVRMTGPIPPEQRSNYVQMIGRGLRELRAFLEKG